MSGQEHLRRRREELRQSRDHLEAILRHAAVGISVQDPNGELIYINDTGARSLGFSSAHAMLETPVQEVIQKYEMLDEAGQPLSSDQLPGRRALKGEQSPATVVRYRVAATGEEFWASVKATPVMDDQGQVQFVVNIWHDITEHKR